MRASIGTSGVMITGGIGVTVTEVTGEMTTGTIGEMTTGMVEVAAVAGGAVPARHVTKSPSRSK